MNYENIAPFMGRLWRPQILEGDMKITYGPAVDVLRIVFSNAPIEESDEEKPGVILDFDKGGNVVGMEILDASSAVARAGKATGEFGDNEAVNLTARVLTLAGKLGFGPIPEVEEIQDIVETRISGIN
jgi:uncharacterized protein YuzE